MNKISIEEVLTILDNFDKVIVSKDQLIELKSMHGLPEIVVIKQIEDKYLIRYFCKIAMPPERYTATNKDLYLSNGEKRKVFSMNNCYDSLIFPQLHSIETLEDIQAIMNKQKARDKKSLEEDGFTVIDNPTQEEMDRSIYRDSPEWRLKRAERRNEYNGVKRQKE